MISIDPSLMPMAVSFLFVFAIVLGLLSSVRMFNKNVNIAIAAVFGIFSASYEPFVSAMQTIIPIAAIVFIIVFVIKLITSSMKEDKGEKRNIGFALVGLFIVIGATWSSISDYFMIEESFNALWIFAIIVIVMLFVIASRIKEEK